MTKAVDTHYPINSLDTQVEECGKLQLFNGTLFPKWDPDSAVTAWGGLVYFAQYLHVSKLFERLVADAPLRYSSPNSPSVVDIIGLIVMSILCGYTRYIHMERLRNDNAFLELFGMRKVLSDTSIRRALKRMDPEECDEWLLKHEFETVAPLLKENYVIDVDNTVKTIYGHQEGAELGYNPHKPGRPSHNYHTFFIGTIRMVLGVDVESGSRHSGKCGMPCVFKFIDKLGPGRFPELLRGDVGYGNDAIMSESEKRGIPFLFKIKRSKKVRQFFIDFENSEAWKDCGAGWQSIDATVRLEGWEKTRRCVFVRREAKSGASNASDRKKIENKVVTTELGFDIVESESGKKRKWDTYALVTSMDVDKVDASALTTIYRERGDCENNFDELKNQWGWCGFVTRKFQPCRTMARLIALVANWWNIYCRLANGEEHMEAVTSRPALMNIVGRITRSGGQKIIHLTSTHAESSRIQAALDRNSMFFSAISERVRQLKANARQLDFETVWSFIVKCAFRVFIKAKDIVRYSDAQELCNLLE